MDVDFSRGQYKLMHILGSFSLKELTLLLIFVGIFRYCNKRPLLGLAGEVNNTPTTVY